MNSQTHSALAEVKGLTVLGSNVLRETEPEQQQEVQERIDDRLNNQKVTFKADSAVLTPNSEKALDDISRYLSQPPHRLRCSNLMLYLVVKAR